MSELKKCPFCGGLPMRCSARRHGFDPAVECTNPDCEVFSIGGDEKWNRRPLEEALEARIAKAEQDKSELFDEGIRQKKRAIEAEARAKEAERIIDELVFALVNCDSDMPHEYELEAERAGLAFLAGAGKLTGQWVPRDEDYLNEYQQGATAKLVEAQQARIKGLEAELVEAQAANE